MRLFMPLITALVLIATTAEAKEPAQEQAERDAAIRKSVAGLRALLTREPPATLADVLHPQAHYDALERAGYFVRVPERARDAVRERFTSVLRTVFARKPLEKVFGAARDLVVLRIEEGEAASQATALVRLSLAPGERSHVRLCFDQRDGHWSLYDVEYLDSGMFLSTEAGLILSALIEGTADDASRTARSVTAANAARETGDLSEAQRLLDELQGREFPPPLRAAIEVLSALVDIDAGRAQEALVHLDHHQQIMPTAAITELVRARALNDLAEHASALEHARRYAEAIEHDVVVDVEIARALLGMDRREEAATVLLATLDDAPGDPDALMWLAQILPAEREDELARRLAYLRDPATKFEQIAEELLDADAFDALERVTRAVAPRLPGHRDVPYYEGLLLGRRGQHREAAAKLEEALKRVTPDVQEELRFYYVDAWLDEMIESGQIPEAMQRAAEQDRANVFDKLHFHLKDTMSPPVYARLLDIAAELPELKRRVRFERADLLREEGKYAQAAELLMPLRRELLPQADILEGAEALLMFHVDDALVRALAHLKRWDEALDVAQAFEAREGSAKYLVLVYALRQDPAKAIHYIQLERERDNGPKWLFHDPDLAGILSTEPYREIREALLGEGD
ncbi:MAG: hypothetical protein AB7T63_12105 [Planctomycetota bacterium]